MVKIHYWHPNTSDKVVFKKDKNDYGHIAISAEYEGTVAYLSLYPHTNLPLGSLIMPWIYVNADFKSYEEHLFIMESDSIKSKYYLFIYLFISYLKK
ncbi:MAG TPA: hypothetical protein VK169_09105 [Saprospiraceae bacterium]|nr:hypothetical protein [Saprospiraceae bacterium]